MRQIGRRLAQAAALRVQAGDLNQLGLTEVKTTHTEVGPEGRQVIIEHRPGLLSALRVVRRLTSTAQKLERQILDETMEARRRRSRS